MKNLKSNKIWATFIKKHLIPGAFFVGIDFSGQGLYKPNLTKQQPQPKKAKIVSVKK